MTLHAKRYPPSSAERFLNCSASSVAVALYPREDSEQSEKGDHAHQVLEDAITFGLKPASEDPDVNESIGEVLDWIKDRRKDYGAECEVFAERRYDIPETGEFGTCDLTLVSPLVLHIGDYKNGYVMTEAFEQMMMYLCGAIAFFGPRPLYKITVFQPNASHIGGTIRTTVVTDDDLRAYRDRVAWAVSTQHFIAGPWCKKTYCEHRGACATFLEWAGDNAVDAWWPSEVNSMSDERLGAALDHAEILKGIRDELRKEALRRILQQDKTIPGYKVVQGRRNRDIADKDGLRREMLNMGAVEEDFYETVYATMDGQRVVIERKFITAAGAERFVKKWAEKVGLPRGGWKTTYENTVGKYIREFAGGLTLERATDARPAHKRGSEFGAIQAPQLTHTV